LTILPPLLGALSLRRLQCRAKRIADEPLLTQLCRQLRLRRPPILLHSADRDMPMTWGILRPKLLLPAAFGTWPAARRRDVMLHELAHIVRRDCLSQWLGHVARAIYWFHPLVWLAARQMCRERERACDDLVLASGADAPDYAEHLLHIASGLQPPAFSAHAAIAMARPSNLETRIVAILDPRTDRRRVTRAGIVVLATLALLVPPLAMLRAQTTAPTTTLHVNTIDSADKPVAGVDVYLFHEIYPAKDEANPRIVRVGPVKSDAAGVATLQIPQPDAKSEWTRTNVFARIPGKMIGASIVSNDAKTPQKILMGSAAPLKGTVTVPAGFAPADVAVSMLSLMINDGTAASQAIYPAHGTWSELFEFPVAADGTFTVPEAPHTGSVYLAGNLKGLGEAQFMSLATGPAGGGTLDLRKEGIIEGRLTREGDNAPAADVIILAHPDHRSGLVVTHPYTATTDAAGKFRIDGLPEAAYTLTTAWATTTPEWVMPNRENVLAKAGETVRDIKLQLERGVLVIGDVTDSQTGKGVKGADVTALNPANAVNATGIGSSQTDDEGHYMLRLPVGASKLYLSGMPDGYEYPPQKEATFTVTIAKGDPQKQGPAFVISRPSKPREDPGVAILSGRVVDNDGKPMPGLPIADDRIERWGSDDMPVQDPKAAITDADGKFQFKAAAGIKHRLTVRDIRWQHATTPQFTPNKDQTFANPDIVVRERPIVGTITGIVVDPAGKPIEGVEVGFRSPIHTDAAGKFSMEVRGENKPVMINLQKTGYIMHNWNDIPPNAKDVRLVLLPGNRAPFEEGRAQPPTPKQAIGKPAPKFDVEKWIHLPRAKPPDLSGGEGRKTFVVFDWNCEEPATVKKLIKQLETEAATANADAIVIFGPQSHETGVRAMLGNDKPNVAIGIDRFDADGKFDISGATMATWGFGAMPHAFVVDEKAIVRREQRGVAKLAAAAK